MNTRKSILKKRKTRRKHAPLKIPIVVICWNELTYIKNMVDQLKHLDHPIILLDNHSTFAPLLEYYKEIKKELGSKIEIRMLKKNHGNTVYLALKHTLPNIYILTDPDIELNKNMPRNFAEILLELSEKYKMYKIGMALDTKHREDFLNCGSPNSSKKLFNYHAQFFKNKIEDDTYELYNAFVDTKGSTLYATLFPCNECAKGIIQKGIKTVVTVESDPTRQHNNVDISLQMFKEAGVEVIFINNQK
jgi:hypothetical protein